MKRFKAFVNGFEEEFIFDDDISITEAEDIMYDWAEQYFEWGYEELKDDNE